MPLQNIAAFSKYLDSRGGFACLFEFGVEFSNRQQFLSTHILINSSVQISETALLNCRSPRKYRSAK
jgi:hypothetical protein